MDYKFDLYSKDLENSFENKKIQLQEEAQHKLHFIERIIRDADEGGHSNVGIKFDLLFNREDPDACDVRDLVELELKKHGFNVATHTAYSRRHGCDIRLFDIYW